MLKMLSIVLVVALLLYLGLREESKEPSPKSMQRVQTEKTAQEEPEEIEVQKKSKTQVKFKKEELEKPLKEEEEVIYDVEDDEPDEEIAEDERAEDYYKESDVYPQGNLVGDAEIEWIEPDKSEKSGGKFGLPPPTF